MLSFTQLERYARWLQQSAPKEIMDRLSGPEVEFVKDYSEMEQKQLIQSSLSSLDVSLQTLDQQTLLQPVYSDPVFARILDEVGEYLLDNG